MVVTAVVWWLRLRSRLRLRVGIQIGTDIVHQTRYNLHNPTHNSPFTPTHPSPPTIPPPPHHASPSPTPALHHAPKPHPKRPQPPRPISAHLSNSACKQEQQSASSDVILRARCAGKIQGVEVFGGMLGVFVSWDGGGGWVGSVGRVGEGFGGGDGGCGGVEC